MQETKSRASENCSISTIHPIIKFSNDWFKKYSRFFKGKAEENAIQLQFDSNPFPFESLPNDILNSILQTLNYTALCRLSCCNKNLNKLASDDLIWRSKYFGLDSDFRCQCEAKSLKERFRDSYRPLTHTLQGLNGLIGMENEKLQTKETYVLPYLFPQFFKSRFMTRLIYGPRNNGKCVLIQSVVDEINLRVKTQNESFGKMELFVLNLKKLEPHELTSCVREFFALGKRKKPCLLVVTGIDHYTGPDLLSDSGNLKTFKSELIIQMSQFNQRPTDHSNSSVVFISQVPWKFDGLLRRRVAKRIYIPAPSYDERKLLLKTLLKRKGKEVTEEQCEYILEKSQRFSRGEITGMIDKVLELEKQGMEIWNAFQEVVNEVVPKLSKIEESQFEDWTKDFA